jgi:casein kinase 1
MASSSSNVVGVHYRVGKKIGEGSFGVIFEGTNLLNNQQVAIKFEPRKSDAPQLRDEYRTYKILVGCPGIPNVYYFGQEGLHNILVIDLLGPSLEDLFDHCNRRFSIKTVVMVAKQMVKACPRSYLSSTNICNSSHECKQFTRRTLSIAISSPTTS